MNYDWLRNDQVLDVVKRENLNHIKDKNKAEYCSKALVTIPITTHMTRHAPSASRPVPNNGYDAPGSFSTELVKLYGQHTKIRLPETKPNPYVRRWSARADHGSQARAVGAGRTEAYQSDH